MHNIFEHNRISNNNITVYLKIIIIIYKIYFFLYIVKNG